MLLCVVVSVTSCAKKGGAPTTAAEGAYAPPPMGDDIAVYERQLAVAEADLRRLGVASVAANLDASAPAPGAGADVAGSADDGDDDDASIEAEQAEREPAAPAADAPPTRDTVTEARKSGRYSRREQRDRCESICDVADSVCTLEGKICSLAAAHAEDPRYQNACARASDDCEVGEEACRACRS